MVEIVPRIGDTAAHKAIRQSDTLVSIVTAFYNEEDAIPAFFAEINHVTASLPCRVELVCVDDGSRDGTQSLLRRQLALDPRIKVVDLARNFGKEAALTAGLAQARGDAVIVLDADLQDPPSVIPQLIAKWREGFDVVYGVRACRGSDSALKRWTAQAFYAIFNRLTDVRIPPGAGDFRLMDRRAVDALLSLKERNRFMKGLFSWIGFKQAGVEFVREARVAGRSHWGYWRLFNFAIDGFTSFSIAPLRLASFIGILISVLGFAYAGYLVARTLFWGVDVPGYASLMVVITCLGGVQLVCLGLIGEYLGRLYIEAKGRPLYIIADVHAADAARAPEEKPVPENAAA
ncbi:MAG TPA: glycosyltransferase family 2 protein [Rhizomicrobium sp.]|jgi:glycosyltransferase involved in cell wall biosynthesis